MKYQLNNKNIKRNQQKEEKIYFKQTKLQHSDVP
jgi:hypothetical protein